MVFMAVIMLVSVFEGIVALWMVRRCIERTSMDAYQELPAVLSETEKR
jgi:hypothetical protein